MWRALQSCFVPTAPHPAFKISEYADCCNYDPPKRLALCCCAGRRCSEDLVKTSVNRPEHDTPACNLHAAYPNASLNASRARLQRSAQMRLEFIRNTHPKKIPASSPEPVSSWCHRLRSQSRSGATIPAPYRRRVKRQAGAWVPGVEINNFSVRTRADRHGFTHSGAAGTE